MFVQIAKKLVCFFRQMQILKKLIELRMNGRDTGLVHMGFENEIGLKESRQSSFLSPVSSNYWNIRPKLSVQ